MQIGSIWILDLFNIARL